MNEAKPIALDGAESLDFDGEDAWEKALAALRGPKGGGSRGYKARKKTEKKIRATATGLSLANMGRNKQFNFKALDVVHKAVSEAAADEGITISEWMEKTIIQVLNLDI
jgi:hypothetical protein